MKSLGMHIVFGPFPSRKVPSRAVPALHEHQREAVEKEEAHGDGGHGDHGDHGGILGSWPCLGMRSKPPESSGILGGLIWIDNGAL